MKDKNYFNKVYTEACELTAYLCNMFNINPKATVSYGGVKVPTILCHADAYDLGLGSNHGDVYHWFIKYGKDMDDVREDVAKLMKSKIIIEDSKVENQEFYRIRKTWEDISSQIGAYTDFNNAKEACDKVGKGYEVYNEEGVAIYPVSAAEKITSNFKVGDVVSLIKGAKYTNNVLLPKWLLESKVYIREIRKNGDLVISTKKIGSITGVVSPS